MGITLKQLSDTVQKVKNYVDNKLGSKADSTHTHSDYITADDIESAIPFKLQSGTTANVTVGANSYENVSVTYSEAFSTLPNVVAGLSTSSTDANIGNISVVVVGGSQQGCSFRVYNASDSELTVGVKWIAYLDK